MKLWLEAFFKTLFIWVYYSAMYIGGFVVIAFCAWLFATYMLQCVAFIILFLVALSFYFDVAKKHDELKRIKNGD